MFGSVPSAILGDKMVALCEMGDRDRRMRKESEDKYCVKKNSRFKDRFKMVRFIDMC